jgi:hypothetical protein
MTLGRGYVFTRGRSGRCGGSGVLGCMVELSAWGSGGTILTRPFPEFGLSVESLCFDGDRIGTLCVRLRRANRASHCKSFSAHREQGTLLSHRVFALAQWMQAMAGTSHGEDSIESLVSWYAEWCRWARSLEFHC